MNVLLNEVKELSLHLILPSSAGNHLLGPLAVTFVFSPKWSGVVTGCCFSTKQKGHQSLLYDVLCNISFVGFVFYFQRAKLLLAVCWWNFCTSRQQAGAPKRSAAPVWAAWGLSKPERHGEISGAPLGHWIKEIYSLDTSRIDVLRPV